MHPATLIKDQNGLSPCPFVTRAASKVLSVDGWLVDTRPVDE
jgi:hypothetical protein